MSSATSGEGGGGGGDCGGPPRESATNLLPVLRINVKALQYVSDTLSYDSLNT